MKEGNEFQLAPEVEANSVDGVPANDWIPTCPVPDRLWTVYIDQGTDSMVSSAREAAIADLAALALPANLSQSLFETYVAGILRQMPLMVEIDELASHGVTDSQAISFLKDRMGPNAESAMDEAWRVTKAWLMHFLSETYILEVGQEVLVKGQKLSR